jgi:hypothetical protein
MLRFTLSAPVAALVLVLTSSPALAADPTPAQIEEAKSRFGKGKELYEKGDKKGAVEEFKAAYRLSKNAVLLYNVGLVYDELGDKRLAVQFYQKFIVDAPDNEKTTDNKKLARARLKVLEAELDGEDAAPVEPKAEPKVEPKAEPKVEPEPKTKAKPAVTEFTHSILDEAPPGKPIDLTAMIPPDADWVVTLHFRIQGEEEFRAVKMKPRFEEIVGRIPAEATGGSAVQYYISVKDRGGRLVAQNGSAASPNIIYLEPKAKPHFYRDTPPPAATKPAEVAPAPKEEDDAAGGGAIDDEDPLAGGRKRPPVRGGGGDGDRGDGTTDGGGINYMKWGTTGGAAVLVGTSVVLLLTAKSYSTALEDERTLGCSQGEQPPCAPFSQYARDLESTGKTYELVGNITLFAGVGVAAVAGYYWYKDLKKPKRGGQKRLPPADEDAASGTRWSAAPMVGPGVIGGGAVIEF